MADRLRVAMVAPPPGRCGVGDYAELLLRELRRRIDIVAVAAPERWDDALNAADLVHLQHEYFLFGGVAPWRVRTASLFRRIRVPIVITAHEFVRPAGPPLRRAAIRISNRLHFGSSKVRRILVHTEADRLAMAQSLSRRTPVAVVRHPVFDPPALPSRDEARRALGVEGRVVVTLLGFLARRKGHRLALDALAHCPPEFLLLIAGGKHPNDRTSYVEQLLQDARPYVSTHRARITGYLDEEALLRALAATDVVVAPFEASSGSGSLARALSCGLPIVASDIEPHREIVALAEHALGLFRSGDALDLARVLEEVAHDPARRAALAEGARAYAVDHSMARFAERTIQEYRAALVEVG